MIALTNAKFKYFSKLTLGMMLLAFASGQVFASPIACSAITPSNGTVGLSMADLENQGACFIGNVLFTFTSGSYVYGADDVSVPAANVQVGLVGTGLTAGQQVGFTFDAYDGGWLATNPDVAGSNEADIFIAFNASMYNAPVNNLLNTATMTISPLITYTSCAPPGPIAGCPTYSGSSGVEAGETLTNHNTETQVGSGINLTIIGNTTPESLLNGGSALTGSLDDFSTSSLDVTKDINIVAFDPGSSSQINSLTETFTYSGVPEPGPFVLAGCGLLMLFMIRRRKALSASLGFLLAIMVTSGAAKASSLCTTVLSPSATLQALESAGSCTIGDILFTFDGSSLVTPAPSGTNSGSFKAPAASGIQAAVVNDGTNIGFQFTPNSPVPSTTGTGQVSFVVTFSATSALGQIKSFATADTVTTAGTGKFQIGSNGSTATIANGVNTLGAYNYSLTASSSNNMSFTPVLAGTTLTITDTFNMSSSGSGLSNSTHISGLKDTLAEDMVVPEPLTFYMMGGALVGIGLLRRTRTRRVSR